LQKRYLSRHLTNHLSLSSSQHHTYLIFVARRYLTLSTDLSGSYLVLVQLHLAVDDRMLTCVLCVRKLHQSKPN